MSVKTPSEEGSLSTKDKDDFNTPEDRKLVRKVDLRVSDHVRVGHAARSNIGNARIIGLVDDLHISPPEYNTALALYFVSYVLFEIPANIILKRFNPQIWLPTLTLFWGSVTVAQGFVTNKAGLFGIRFCDRIFILEGVITLAFGLFAYLVVPTWSHKAKFLTSSEKERLLARLDADSDAALIEKFQWKYVKQALTDHLVWGYAFLFHGFAFVLYSLSLFMPSIIAGLGYKSWQAQLMTVPPNTLASFSIWGTVWLSSKVNRRAHFIIGAALVAILGYIILLTTKTPGAQYVGVHFAAAGVYTGNALLLSWPGENVSAQTKRAIAVAMQITIGDIGAIAGVLIYRPNLSAHRFRTPHIISIGYLLFAILVTIYLATYMSRENKRRDEVLATSETEIPLSTPEQRQEQGDREIRYRYVI
ncbi:hypothetical protein H1R20_g2485, partial [Candolleomyces eurysporus]